MENGGQGSRGEKKKEIENLRFLLGQFGKKEHIEHQQTASTQAHSTEHGSHKNRKEREKMRFWDNDKDRQFDEAIDELIKEERQLKEKYILKIY